MDSYANVVQSLALFWRQYASWPARLTIVSHAFKRQRFLDLHCRAIGYPLQRVTYPVRPEEDPEGAKDSRGVADAVAQWTNDPHGTTEPLSGKRRRRNPWSVPQTLFDNEADRVNSGIRTCLQESDPVEEYLLPDENQPWCSVDSDQRPSVSEPFTSK